MSDHEPSRSPASVKIKLKALHSDDVLPLTEVFIDVMSNADESQKAEIQAFLRELISYGVNKLLFPGISRFINAGEIAGAKDSIRLLERLNAIVTENGLRIETADSSLILENQIQAFRSQLAKINKGHPLH